MSVRLFKVGGCVRDEQCKHTNAEFVRDGDDIDGEYDEYKCLDCGKHFKVEVAQ